MNSKHLMQFISLLPVYQNAICFSLTISDLIDLKRSVLKLSSHPENLIFALKHKANDSWAI